MKGKLLKKLVCSKVELYKDGIMFECENKYYYISFTDKKTERRFKSALMPSHEMFPGSDNHE